MWLGAVFTIATLGAPLSLDAETATKLSLASMHVVAGAAFLITLARVRLGQPSPSDDPQMTASPAAP